MEQKITDDNSPFDIDNIWNRSQDIFILTLLSVID
jgi:hypothetical protein